MQVSLYNPYSALYSQSNERPNALKRSVIWLKIYCKAFQESCRQYPVLATIAATSIVITSVITGVLVGLIFTVSLQIVATVGLMSTLPFLISEACTIIGGIQLTDLAKEVIEEWREQHYSTIPTNQKVALIFQSTEDHNGVFKSARLLNL